MLFICTGERVHVPYYCYYLKGTTPGGGEGGDTPILRHGREVPR